MWKKLTLTIDEEVYNGLREVVGPRKISHFIEDLVRPHVIKDNLYEDYKYRLESIMIPSLSLSNTPIHEAVEIIIEECRVAHSNDWAPGILLHDFEEKGKTVTIRAQNISALQLFERMAEQNQLVLAIEDHFIELKYKQPALIKAGMITDVSAH